MSSIRRKLADEGLAVNDKTTVVMGGSFLLPNYGVRMCEVNYIDYNISTIYIYSYLVVNRIHSINESMTIDRHRCGSEVMVRPPRGVHCWLPELKSFQEKCKRLNTPCWGCFLVGFIPIPFLLIIFWPVLGNN